MIRSCSGPDSSFGGRGSGRMPSALARRIRSKAYDAQVRAGVVLRLRSSRAVKRSRSVSAASRPGARMSIRSGSRPSRWARRTAASTSTVDLPVPGAPGIRTGPEPCGTSTAASWSGDSTGPRCAACGAAAGAARNLRCRVPGGQTRPALCRRAGCGLCGLLCGCCAGFGCARFTGAESGFWLGMLTRSFHHRGPTVYARSAPAARQRRRSGRTHRRSVPSGRPSGPRASVPRRCGGSRRSCPAAGFLPRRYRARASRSCPGGASPLAFRTRHQGTELPWWLMTEPIWRGPPDPRSSATSP